MASAPNDKRLIAGRRNRRAAMKNVLLGEVALSRLRTGGDVRVTHATCWEATHYGEPGLDVGGLTIGLRDMIPAPQSFMQVILASARSRREFAPSFGLIARNA